MNIIIRRKNEFTIKNRRIFLNEIFQKKIKENNFYFKINIVKVK